MYFKTIPDKNFGGINLFNHPEECPDCHFKTTPNYLSHKFSIDKRRLFVFFHCPNVKCDSCYTTGYLKNVSEPTFVFDKVIKGTIKSEIFSMEISDLSPAFVKIYNEANFAEQNELLEICGVGYRKALEFLIKDYLACKKPENENEIKKALLGKCINEYVDDTRIKETAKRAVWLGNDHTHYVKKWEGKDLSDLKLLIKLSVNWIESELMTEQFVKSMN